MQKQRSIPIVEVRQLSGQQTAAPSGETCEEEPDPGG